MGSPLVRGVRLEDLPRLAVLEHEAFGYLGWPLFVLRQTWDIFGSWWLLVEEQETETAWGHALNAFQGDDKSVAWVLGLAVHPDRQGKGYGEVLLANSINLLREHGADVIRLAVKPENKRARGLYDKLGFLDHNEVMTDYFGPGEDRIILTLLLPYRPR